MAGSIEYTIVVTLDGKRIPVQVRLLEKDAQRLGNAFDSELKKASTAFDKFGRSAMEAHEKLVRALSPIQRQNTYLAEMVRLYKSGGDAIQWKVDKTERDNAIRAAGLGLYSREGKELREAIKLNQNLSRELDALTAARRREAQEASKAKRVAATIENYKQNTADMQAAAAAARRGAAAEEDYKAKIQARNVAKRLGIATSSQEAQAIEREIIAQNKLKKEIDEVARAKDRHSAAASRLRGFILGLVASFGVFSFAGFTRDVVDSSLAMDRINRTLLVSSRNATLAGNEYKFVRGEVGRLGLDLKISAFHYAQLAAAAKSSNLEVSVLRQGFTAASEAATVMGLSSQKTELILYALQQMISKGRVYREELVRQMGDAMPGAFSMAARAMGVTEVKMNEMLKTGISTTEFLPKLFSEWRRTFGPGVTDAVNSNQAAINRWKTAVFEAQVAVGKGFVPAVADAATKLSEFIALNEQTAESLGMSLGNSLKAGVDLLILFGSNIEVVKASLIALIAMKVAFFFLDLASGIRNAAGAMAIFNKTILISPIGPYVAAIGILAGAFYLLTKSIDNGRPSVTQYDSLMRAHIKTLGEAKAATVELAAVQATASTQIYGQMNTEAGNALKRSKEIQAQIDSLTDRSKYKSGVIPLSARSEVSKLQGELKTVNNEINIAFNRTLPEARQKMLEFNKNYQQLEELSKKNSSAVEELTDKEKKRIDNIDELLERQDRELRQAKELLEARKISAEEAEKVSRRHAGEDAAMQAAHRDLKMSQQDLELVKHRTIRKLELVDAINKIGEAEERAEAAYQKSGDAITKLNDLERDATKNSQQWGQATLDLYVATLNLEKQLNALSPASAKYKIISDQLTDSQNKLVDAESKMTEVIQREISIRNQAAREAEAEFNSELALLSQEARALELGGAARRAYNRELQIHQEVLRLLVNIKPFIGEGPEEFSKRWRDAAKEARIAVEDLYNRIDADRILEPMRQVATQTKDIFLDAMADIATGTKVSFENLFKDLLRMWIRAIMEMVVRWIAAQRTMAASSALNQGPTQTGGNLSGLGMGQFVSGAAPGGAGWGGLFSGGAYGGGATGGAAAAGAWFAAWYAMVLVVKQWKDTHRNTKVQIDILEREGKIVAGQARGALRQADALQKNLIDPMIEGINSIIGSLGGTIESMDKITVQREGRSNKTKFLVRYFDEYGNQLVKKFGNDAQAAMEFGIIQAIRQAKISGLDPIVAAAIRRSTQTRLEAFQKDIALAQKVALLGKPGSAQDFRAVVSEIDVLVKEMLRILGPSKEFAQAIHNLSTNMLEQLNVQRDALTDRKKTAQEEYEERVRRAKAWNAELGFYKVELELRLSEIQGRIASAKAHQGYNEVLYGGARFMAGLTTEYGRALYNAGVLSAEGLKALEASEAAYRELLANLPKPIDIEKEIKFRPDGKGGATKDIKGDRERVEDALRERERAKLSEYHQSLTAIHDRYDALIPLAHKNAELLERIAKARKEEIDALVKSERAKLDPWLKDFGKSDFAKNAEEMHNFFAELDKLPRAVMPDWMIEIAKGNWLKDQVGELEERIHDLGAFDPVIADLTGVKKTAQTLRADIIALGASAEETARLLEAVTIAEEHRIEMMQNDLIAKLYGYLENDERYQEKIQKFNEDRIKLEFALLRAQLEAFGLWQEYAQTWSDAQEAAIAATKKIREEEESSERTHYMRNAEIAERAAEEAKKEEEGRQQAIEQFYKLLQDIGDYRKSLIFSELSPLTLNQKREEAQRQYLALKPLAEARDIAALGKVREIVDQFLVSSKEYHRGGIGFVIDWNEAFAWLEKIEKLQFSEGNVVYPSNFFAPTSTTTNTSTAAPATNGSGIVINFNAHEVTVGLQNVASKVEDVKNAIAELRNEITQTNNLTNQNVGSALNSMSRVAVAVERIANS